MNENLVFARFKHFEIISNCVDFVISILLRIVRHEMRNFRNASIYLLIELNFSVSQFYLDL